jgi:hypothetical protein
MVARSLHLVENIEPSGPDPEGPTMPWSAWEATVSVVGASHLDSSFSDCGPLESCPRPPGGPEGSPDLRLVGPINLDGVVSTGGSLVGPTVAGRVGRCTSVDNHAAAVYSQLETQAVGVGVGGEIGRAGWSDVDDQVQSIEAHHDVSRRLKDRQVSLGAGSGAEYGEAIRAEARAVVEDGNIAVRHYHRPQPSPHGGDGVTETRHWRPPRRLQQGFDIEKVSQHLCVIPRGELVMASVRQHLATDLVGQMLSR